MGAMAAKTRLESRLLAFKGHTRETEKRLLRSLIGEIPTSGLRTAVARGGGSPLGKPLVGALRVKHGKLKNTCGGS